jgi:hypothetical protein
MDKMQSFYDSLFQFETQYMMALADIARGDRKQLNALLSDMGWQSWGEQSQRIGVIG